MHTILKQKTLLTGLALCLVLFSNCSKDKKIELEESSKLEAKEISIQLVDDKKALLSGEATVLISKRRPDVNMLVTREELKTSTGKVAYKIFTQTQLRITVLKKGYNPVYQDLDLKAEAQNISIVLTPKSGLTVLSYNVLEGFDSANPSSQATRMDAYVQWVGELDPDVVVYQEMNGFTEAKLLAFAKRYGHGYSALLKVGGFPTALTSKTALNNVQRIQVASNVPAFRVHGYIYAETQGVDIFAIHLSSQSNDLVVHEAKEILAHINRLPNKDNVMVAGDFNSISRQDEKFLGSNLWLRSLQKYRPARVPTNYIATDLFVEAGYTDAQTINNSYFRPSYPAKTDYLSSDFLGIRLDYVYLSEQLSKQCDYVEILQDNYSNTASDHYPFLLHFNK